MQGALVTAHQQLSLGYPIIDAETLVPLIVEAPMNGVLYCFGYGIMVAYLLLISTTVWTVNRLFCKNASASVKAWLLLLFTWESSNAAQQPQNYGYDFCNQCCS
jgi:hypothetical protein